VLLARRDRRVITQAGQIYCWPTRLVTPWQPRPGGCGPDCGSRDHGGQPWPPPEQHGETVAM